MRDRVAPVLAYDFVDSGYVSGDREDEEDHYVPMDDV